MSSFGEVWSGGHVARNPRRPGPSPATLIPASTRGNKARAKPNKSSSSSSTSPSPFPPTTPSSSTSSSSSGSPPRPQGQQRRQQHYAVGSPRAGHQGFVKSMVTKAAAAAATTAPAVLPPPRPAAHALRAPRAPLVSASPRRAGGGARTGAVARFGDAASDQDSPPAGLPTLHQSSSGSEDEGFGDFVGYGSVGVGGGHEAMLRRFSTHVLTSAPMIPLSPRGRGAPAPAPAPLVDARSRWMAVLPSAAPPPLPARTPASTTIPRATPGAGAGAGAGVKASVSPPPPLPPRTPRAPARDVAARETAAAAAAATAGPAPAPPVLKPRPQSLPRGSAAGCGKARAASSSGRMQEEDEGRNFFCDARLEATLGLIRSGQDFCDERHVVVDFVKRAKALSFRAGVGRAEVQDTGDLLRHALLLTHAALYLLEVEMLPHEHQPPSSSSKDPGLVGTAAATAPGAGAMRRSDAVRPNPYGSDLRAMSSNSSSRSRSGSGSSSSGHDEPPSKMTFSPPPPPMGALAATATGPAAGRARPPKVVLAGGGGGGGGAGVGGAAEKAKIKSIKMMDRLQPSELLRVSLPFKEITLRNGDVVARRGCGVVLHTRVEGQGGHVWLKCRSNQDRGALVDALVPWFEANSPSGKELNVQQVPESPLATQLARINAAEGAGGRHKDTDCVIS